ncbi:hypothetical protein B2D07_09750 [Desulfococcus multivorans]|uniref:Type II and III secretion system protein n=2 Tax=Desulfococcus multivorans TaxID=897 RepID=S7TCU0_DESML|nr:Flp pilus assembly protein, secretin [Desulfococcus multivorans]AQV01022.2 hypothetical protein B2D07_09750 [Desulfococcus multivorans]EPR34350.1 type II and III secretion system protein [Desulfococcus multivorans DSM 2059]SJZ49107.1 pilus assembly protein CpaC [Desulfococcus multivorans DSM 2059]
MHKRCRRTENRMVSLWMVVMIAALMGFYDVARASDFQVLQYPEPQTLDLVVGQTIILKNRAPVRYRNLRINITDPKIAKADVPYSPDEILITGKNIGSTDMKLWQDQRLIEVFHLNVGFDVSRLKQKLNALLPQEKDLQVLSTHDSITLAGKVSNLTNLTTALSLASAYAPEDKIHNMAEVGGVHQVMLEVRVAEMQRSIGRDLGINFTYSRGKDFFGSALSALNASDLTGLNGLLEGNSGSGNVFSQAVSTILRFSSGDSLWTFFFDVLKSEGLAKILAEPTLMALSGQTATFRVGGEFPYPVQDDDGITIEFRPYGVGLNFTPTVMSQDKIGIQVAPSVSELDFANAVQVGGVFVPALTTREASTTIELGDGESFAIAGLLQDNVRNAVSKYPILGDIPVLGALFRSQQFQKNKTELVIIVTPHIVKPIQQGNPRLPTDFFNEPDDAEFYLLGAMEGFARRPVAGVGEGTLEGSFGHGIPSVGE